MAEIWERDGFFERGLKAERQHFIPQAALLRRFLDPREWQGDPRRKNHLRELDLRSGRISWRGPAVSGQETNLNVADGFSSENYWTFDDNALSEGARSLAEGRLEGVWLMVPGVAALQMRAPGWLRRLEDAAQSEGEAHPRGYARRGAVLIADRVKRDWVAALDRGFVSITVQVIDDADEGRFVIGDCPIRVEKVVSDGTTLKVDRPAWIWDAEWFPAIDDPEPPSASHLRLSIPVSSVVHITVDANPANRVGSEARRVEIDGSQLHEINRAHAQDAHERVWSGRARDLERLNGNAD